MTFDIETEPRSRRVARFLTRLWIIATVLWCSFPFYFEWQDYQSAQSYIDQWRSAYPKEAKSIDEGINWRRYAPNDILKKPAAIGHKSCNIEDLYIWHKDFYHYELCKINADQRKNIDEYLIFALVPSIALYAFGAASFWAFRPLWG